MTFTYNSTRGSGASANFEEAILSGLAPDGGLYIPDSLPYFDSRQLTAMARLDYAALAAELLWPFFANQWYIGDRWATKNDLYSLLQDSYAEFQHPKIAPLTQLGPDEWLLELFHGPTLAFKDFALQFLGRLLDRLLQQRNRQATILGATSGDTGSAAIAGCRGRDAMSIVILHPHKRISAIQRRQMTTIDDSNIHNIAIEGSFDDCQNIVKTLFVDDEFRSKQRLTAVNSINWARIIAQIVYYFYAVLQLQPNNNQPVHFSVPTGNFGDIYAGYLAKQMGLPIGKLVIASNCNDILTRCFNTGRYEITKVITSLSPSMDIQISSNFERLLYEFYNRDADIINKLMHQLKEKGCFELNKSALERLHANFIACSISDTHTVATISDVFTESGIIIDPHSAVAVAAARKLKPQLDGIVITLATAHPAKFPDAVKKAITAEITPPKQLADIWQKEEKFQILPAKASAVRDYISQISL